MANIDSYNFWDRHTHKQTLWLYDRRKKTRQLEKFEKETARSLKHPMECKKVRKQDIYVVWQLYSDDVICRLTYFLLLTDPV